MTKKHTGLDGTVFNWAENVLFTKSTKQQASVVNHFMTWLQTKARLKSGPRVPDLILEMEPKLRKLAKNMTLEVVDGKAVFKSDAESMALLSMLRRGSSWFDPHPDVDSAIMTALMMGA